MFVRGGNVYPGRALGIAGNGGGYWSSVGAGSYDAYYLSFGSGGVLPSGDYGRYFGQSVRCVALGG